MGWGPGVSQGQGTKEAPETGCSVPRVRLRLKGALSFGALCHGRGSRAMERNRHVNWSVAASAPPASRLRPPRAAHLDSNEDTGFSTELLRSQGFRPASVNSFYGRRVSGLRGIPVSPIPGRRPPNAAGAERL